jgi:hypothetical protein
MQILFWETDGADTNTGASWISRIPTKPNKIPPGGQPAEYLNDS